MIANLKPYSAMKDSGIEWLGGVPEHWAIRKLGQIGKLSKGSGGNKSDEVSKGIPCIRYGDLYTTHNFFIRKSRSFIPKDKAAEYTAIKFGDVLFAGSGETIDEIGKSVVNLMQDDACCGGDVILFRPSQQFEPSYLGYAMDCRPAAAQKATMGRGITVMHIYGNQLKHLTFPLPPLPEQAAIVRFLDHADRRIRRYIRAKQKLISLLEEQKQAIIHQAVTGQIDVRTGQPYPAYKDSGLEWLGKVPEYWEIMRLKQLSRIQGGFAFSTDSFGNEGIPVVRMNNIRRGLLGLYDVVRIPEDKCKNAFALNEGDIIYGLSGSIGATGSLGNYAIVRRGDVPAQLNQRIARFRPITDRITKKFLVGSLQTKVFYEQVLSYTTGTAQFNVSTNDIGNVVLALPPLPEQAAIVHFLGEATTRLDTAITESRRQINLLREYRTRLIADVVTGKVDVREAEAELPEIDPLADESDAANTPDTETESDIDELNSALEEAKA